MRTQGPVLFSAMLVAGMATAAGAQTWNEDFNGSSVNTADWNFETGTAANNELEWYQTNNATVAGGVLTIQARRQAVGGMQYTSSRINTAGKHQFQYGHVEARIQGPLGQGYWPAFWMLGANIGSVGWPACGEIDIMETVNSLNTNFGTIHWGDPGSTHVSYGVNHAMNFPSYNTFAIDWNASSITWLLNGASYGAANIANNINDTAEFHAPFFIILNFAVGGDWPGSPNSGTVFPANLNVDYVHVSPLGGATATRTPTATATRTPTATARTGATATRTPTRAATATATTGGSGKCTGVPAFATCTAYANGGKVVFNNTLYHSIAAIPNNRDCPPNSPYNPGNDNWWVNDGGC